MAVVRSKLNQRIIVNLIGGKNLDLVAKGTADVSERELTSPHLAHLISQGDIIVIRNTNAGKQTQNNQIVNEVDQKPNEASSTVESEVEMISNQSEKPDNGLKSNIEAENNEKDLQPQNNQKDNMTQKKSKQSKPVVKTVISTFLLNIIKNMEWPGIG